MSATTCLQCAIDDARGGPAPVKLGGNPERYYTRGCWRCTELKAEAERPYEYPEMTDAD